MWNAPCLLGADVPAPYALDGGCPCDIKSVDAFILTVLEGARMSSDEMTMVQLFLRIYK